MTFTDQWANRHDGECEVESYVKSYGGLRPIYVDCHCYRRWLEARLGEMERKRDAMKRELAEEKRLHREHTISWGKQVVDLTAQARGARQAFDVADEIAVREKRRADDLARRLDALTQGMAGLLPPKGAE